VPTPRALQRPTLRRRPDRDDDNLGRHALLLQADGFFDGKTLTCHQHLWQWDIHSGSAIGLAEQLELLLSLQLWSGIAVGAALVAGAAYFRGRNNDM
jgi:hypothetical protein